MFEQQPTLPLLFEQLGLASDEKSIDDFVKNHQLSPEVSLSQAGFWSASQKEFLRGRCEQDDEWAIVVDELNELLHAVP